MIAFGRTCQAIAAHDEHITHAPVGQIHVDPGPTLRAFGGLDPDTQHVLDSVDVDTDRDVG